MTINESISNEYSFATRQFDGRLILDDAASGARNMATDESLLRVAAANLDFAPTLRFYDWQPSCLSIGRFQRADTLNLDTPLDNAFSWIRRPTGGRAVWHQHEITYSIVVRAEILPRESRSVAASYRWINEGFLRGLESLGVRAEIASATASNAVASNVVASNVVASNAVVTNDALRATSSIRSVRRDTSNCFATATRADFVVDGRKLLGAAQCRVGGAILQHGSLLLDIDRAQWQNRLGGDMTQVVALRDLGVTSSPDEVRVALIRGIMEKLGVQFHEAKLSPAEEKMANVLLHKYEGSLWNWEGRDARVGE